MRPSRLPVLMPSTIDARTCSGVTRSRAVRCGPDAMSATCTVMSSPPGDCRLHGGSVTTRASVTHPALARLVLSGFGPRASHRRSVAGHAAVPSPKRGTFAASRTTCGGISFADRLRRNIQSEGAREEGIAMFRDIRFAIRSATRNPVLTAVIVISLALGIGANTTIFTLINAVFLRPLPVSDPGRLAQVFTVMPKSTAYQSVSLANYRDFRDRVSEFSGLAAYQFIGANLTGGTEPVSIGGQL